MVLKRIKQKTLIRDIFGKFGFDYPKFYKMIFFKLLDKESISKETVRLGSDYGYWELLENKNLYNSTIISAGVGEDISFDIEYLNKFQGRVIFVDPTPRSSNHLAKVLKCIGNNKMIQYKNGGFQPIESYDLSNLKKNQFYIEEFALYKTSNKVLNFYPPKNSQHVSYSISNIQNVSKETDSILSVKTTTLKDLMMKYKLEHLSLLKLDIEGAAEDHVIPNMLQDKIYPDQILVEFDNLHFKGFFSHIKMYLLIKKLLSKDYKIIKTNYLHNMLFVKNIFC